MTDIVYQCKECGFKGELDKWDDFPTKFLFSDKYGITCSIPLEYDWRCPVCGAEGEDNLEELDSRCENCGNYYLSEELTEGLCPECYADYQKENQEV